MEENMKHYFENDKLPENIFLSGLMYAQQLPVTTEPISLHASGYYEIDLYRTKGRKYWIPAQTENWEGQ